MRRLPRNGLSFPSTYSLLREHGSYRGRARRRLLGPGGGFRVLSRPPARTVKIRVNPGMVVIEELFQRADAELFVYQYRHSVTDREQAVEIVRHHEDGQPKTGLQIPYQFVKSAGGNRI